LNLDSSFADLSLKTKTHDYLFNFLKNVFFLFLDQTLI
jgi:hypothetical protein